MDSDLSNAIAWVTIEEPCVESFCSFLVRQGFSIPSSCDEVGQWVTDPFVKQGV